MPKKFDQGRIKKVTLGSDDMVSTIEFYRDAGDGARDEVIIKGHKYLHARIHVENAKGVKVRQALYGKTAAALEKKVKAALANPARSVEVAKMTVEAYFRDRFLPGAKNTIRPATYASYLNAVDTRIVPMIGKAKFVSLKPDNVRAWMTEMEGDAKGARADQIAVQILKRGYNRAFLDNLIASNPIAGVKPPKAEPRDKNILDLKETIQFLRAIRLSETASEWFPIMYCAVSLGMREGELLGLTWAKVDLLNKRVRVVEQCGPLADGKTLGQVPVKSLASKRILYLDELTIRALQMQKGKHATLVFPGRKGGYVLKRTLSATVMPRLLKLAGFDEKRIWFHLLRGGGASILSSDNVATPKIDKWLGHSISGIAGKYIKIGDSDLEAVSEVMARGLKPVWS